jgi:hypothetical protein
VSGASYIVFVLGLVLEVSLIWRLMVGRLWRQYPYFFSYVAFFVAQTLALFLILRIAPREYASWYWGTGILNLLTRFLVIGEVFRQAFPGGSPLRRVVAGGFLAVVLVVGTGLTGMLWGIEAYGKSHSLYLALQRSFGFAQAVLILVVLIVARYYQVQLGRNAWGIAVAFGMYCSLDTANCAFMDLFLHSFFPYWQLLGPLSLVAMLGMWTWAVWANYPNPVVAGVGQKADHTNDLREWAAGWGQTASTIRKVTNP